MDGFTLVKKLRDMKVRTPVIMLTARVELQDKLQGFDAGAEDYLTKPFEIEELDARVKVLLRKNGKMTTMLMDCYLSIFISMVLMIM